MVTQHDPTTTTMTQQNSSNSSSTTISLNHIINSTVNTTFSYSSNIMLAAIISLLLVILFVLLLHLYAKWFLAQSRARRHSRTPATATNSHFLGASRFRFHTYTFDDTIFFDSQSSKGLDDSIIRSIPGFVYNPLEHEQVQECVICLSVFEKNEAGKKLPMCGHAFHVECIDMWLHSHCTCPICRASVIVSEPERLSGTVSTNDDDDRLGLADAAADSSSTSTLEIVIEIPDLCKNGDSSLTPPQQSLPMMSCSLKRMLSRKRSVECKVHPSSSNTSELVS